MRVLNELLIDLYFYYTSSFPLLLIIDAFRRIKRRIKYLWHPPGPGRPPILENLLDLILDMKRSNWLWGALRISPELRLLGISIHKKTISKILKENGFTTPPMKYQPPTWEALIASGSDV
jgi:transposase